MLMLEKTPESVYRFVYKNPRKANILTESFVDDFLEKIRRVLLDESAKMVVFETEGKTFSAGADLLWFESVRKKDFNDAQLSVQKILDLYKAIMSIKVPTLVKVQGSSLGGGVGLVACFDIVCASSESTFQLPEVKIGILPAMAFYPLKEKIGKHALKKLFLVGDQISSEKALDLGIVDYLFDHDFFHERSEDIIKEILKGDPFAQKEIKKLFSSDSLSDSDLPAILVNRILNLQKSLLKKSE